MNDVSVLESAKDVRWELSGLFSGVDDAAIPGVLSGTLEMAREFQDAYKGKLGDLNSEELLGALVNKEGFLKPFYRLGQFVNLVYSVDMSDDEVKGLLAKVEETGAEISNLLLFFGLEFGQLPVAKYREFESAFDGVLERYSYGLAQTYEKAKYRLSEKEEQMVNLKDLTGSEAMVKIYEELTADFEYMFEIDGNLEKMNGSQLRALRQHEDQDVRQRAMSLFYTKYDENKLVITHLYNNIVKDFNTERKLRGYESSISVMNIGNDLDSKAVDLLHEVTSASNHLVNRYYKLKRKILGLKEMTLADIYAPMPESNKTYSWEEASGMVLESFKRFDSEFYELAKRMFDEKRVDAPVEPKKRGGAYCSSSLPEIGPFVFLNYMGRPRDISTISHEFGHAIHAFFSEDLPISSYHAILPLCETASVFCEMLLTDYIREVETEKSAKIALLTGVLEDMFATSHRQNMFSCFEMKAHEKIGEGLMTTNELCDLYYSGLKEMFGDSVDYTEEYKWEWATIPHIFNVPFYVHSYNFGNLLVLALYQQYLEEGEGFIPKLKMMLSLGSSVSPQEICEVVGVDITDRGFWEKSLLYVEGLIDELEGLVG